VGEGNKVKIIGSMFTWNNLEFFKCALKQALEFCDEVVLSEGCHSHQYPMRSTDGTCEYIETIKDHPKIRFVEFKERVGKTYDSTMLKMRRDYPKLSPLYKPGNWVFCCDDDMFYFRKDFEKIRATMHSPDAENLGFFVRQFFYNFRFNLLEAPRGDIRAYKIMDDLRLFGTGSPCHSDGGRLHTKVVPDVVGFHYGHVKKPERMKARWVMSVEKGTEASVEYFEKWMSISWNEDEDIFKSANIIEEIRAFTGLNIYDDEHPEFLADHPWRNIRDVREIKC
jgi:hypothetical protein